MKNVSATTLQTPKSVKEREKVLQVLELIPLQPMEKTTVTQVVPIQPMDVHSGADI